MLTRCQSSNAPVTMGQTLTCLPDNVRKQSLTSPVNGCVLRCQSQYVTLTADKGCILLLQPMTRALPWPHLALFPCSVAVLVKRRPALRSVFVKVREMAPGHFVRVATGAILFLHSVQSHGMLDDIFITHRLSSPLFHVETSPSPTE